MSCVGGRTIARVAVIVALVGGALYGLGQLGDSHDEERTSGSTAPQRSYSEPKVIGRLQVPALTELSGLAASSRNRGLLWAHNDSGDEPFLYCLEPTGAGCGIWRVAGAAAVDWEDIASAPDEDGDPSLYIADIGDNARSRRRISIYRVEEPRVASASTRHGGTLQTETFALTYPDRPHDAEAIVVHRETRDLYVITKDYSGTPAVFVARAPLADSTELERVTSVRIDGLLTEPTGASLSPDGNRVVFSTYVGGYELVRPEGEPFDTIWRQEATPVDLGSHDQNEAVTYSASGDRIISASEGARSAIYAVTQRS